MFVFRKLFARIIKSLKFSVVLNLKITGGNRKTNILNVQSLTSGRNFTTKLNNESIQRLKLINVGREKCQ